MFPPRPTTSIDSLSLGGLPPSAYERQAVYATPTARAAATPAYPGQQGVSLSDGSIYIANGTTGGAWQPQPAPDFDAVLASGGASTNTAGVGEMFVGGASRMGNWASGWFGVHISATCGTNIAATFATDGSNWSIGINYYVDPSGMWRQFNGGYPSVAIRFLSGVLSYLYLDPGNQDVSLNAVATLTGGGFAPPVVDRTIAAPTAGTFATDSTSGLPIYGDGSAWHALSYSD
jgi:hypothetical protein